METSPAPAETAPAHLDTAARRRLLEIARNSIRHGLKTGQPLPIRVPDQPAALQQRRATFVTLTRAGLLRGCIGSLEAQRPLALDVAENAFASAFRDPRFAPLAAAEEPEIHIDISALTAPAPFPFASEADLLARLRPGRHGLILSHNGHRATFLPSVWEQLPDPRTFVQHLRRKAGITDTVPATALTALVYESEYFGEGDLGEANAPPPA
jgi:AmmeMemoRadiSam system protein A